MYVFSFNISFSPICIRLIALMISPLTFWSHFLMIFHKFNFLITVPNDLSHTFYFFYNFSQQHQLILVSCLLSILLIHQTKGRRRHHPESDRNILTNIILHRQHWGIKPENKCIGDELRVVYFWIQESP